MHIRYHCDFCPRSLAGGSEAADQILDHEPTCEYNPATRCCATCRHHIYTEGYRGFRKSPFKCALFNDREYRRNCPVWEGKDKP